MREKKKRREERRKGKRISQVWILVWKSSVLYGFEYGICLVLV